MIELITHFFTWFTFETGIIGKIRQYSELGLWCIFIIGFMSCFFGFKVFRAYFSVFMFGLVTSLCCLFFKERWDWGSVTTCFAVVGVFVALLSFEWKKAGAIIMCGIFGAMTASLFLASNIVVLLIGIVCIVAVILFPVITICFLSSLWGSIILSEILPVTNAGYCYLILTIIAFGLQLFFNRKQDLFKETCPKWMKHKMEARRRANA